MVLLEAAEADDYRLVDLEREEAEEAAAAEAKLAAKRERAKVALGMLGARFERLDDGAAGASTAAAAAALPPRPGARRGHRYEEEPALLSELIRQADVASIRRSRARAQKMRRRLLR